MNVHQLDYILKPNIDWALNYIDVNGIPKEHQWNEYYIWKNQRKYPFKYSVELASSHAGKTIKTTHFTSNVSSRKYIASLGFHIAFTDHANKEHIPKYWVGASKYGAWENQIDMYQDFMKHNYWATDHDLSKGTGLRIAKIMHQVETNDRICIRYLDRKGGMVSIPAMGTVYDIQNAKNGRIGVKWDYNPPKYRGLKPTGKGSGNWWGTFVRMSRPQDINIIFRVDHREKRIARLAWNSNGWVLPSGPDGKSDHKDSHEAKYGYGHEEWLFDTSKIIEGYHYAFLEPIRKQQTAYCGNSYDVWLYSIDGISKKRYWIGEILKVKVIDDAEASRVKSIYKSRGWLDEMEQQVKDSGANPKGFSNWEGVDLFNVRFKVEDIKLNDDPYVILPADHPIASQTRYVFGNYDLAFNIKEFQEEEGEGKPFSFEADDSDPDETNSTVKKKKSFRKPKAVEITYLHEAISKSMFKYLKKVKRFEARREHPAGHGATRIDMVAKNGKELIFYEIKTYHSLRTSIREAIGQLMEYSHWPDKSKADKLVIVTQRHERSQKAIKYVQHLRDSLQIPLYYQWYDLENEELSKEH